MRVSQVQNRGGTRKTSLQGHYGLDNYFKYVFFARILTETANTQCVLTRGLLSAGEVAYSQGYNRRQCVQSRVKYTNLEPNSTGSGPGSGIPGL